MHIRALLARPWFARLLSTRLVSQTADGVFQASLASAVFFNPDHQTDARQAAAGFVVLLLPYSLVGPFAGVFLDRWSRQRVLVRANLLRNIFIAASGAALYVGGARGAGFYAAALCALSVNRFYLSALSAGLPHLVADDELVVANAVTTTAGSFVTIAGLGLGIGLRHVVGAGDHGDAVIAWSSVALYLAAAAVAAGIPRRQLGPDGDDPARLVEALRQVLLRLRDGARDVAAHPAAAAGVSAIALARLLYGISTIGTLLLYRNYFHDDGVLRAGITGLGQAFAASAVGFAAAAFATPLLARRLGVHRVIPVVFVVAAVTDLAFGLPFRLPLLVAGAAALSFSTQCAKICVDAVVQHEISDAFRGRVFSLYDVVFNLTFVVAAVVAAIVLPSNGKSYPIVLSLGLLHAAGAAGYAAVARRMTTAPASASAAG